MNYPIKYAILAIEDQVGWTPGTHELEREYETSGYIVSKVYLIAKKEVYKSNGTSNMRYQVVFPYDNIDILRQNIGLEYSRNKPQYNYGECFNFVEVDEIFEDFDKAKETANNMNQQLRRKYCNPIAFERTKWSEIIEQKQKEFDERLNSYLSFEEYIQRNTEDMIIISETQKILVKKLSDNLH